MMLFVNAVYKGIQCTNLGYWIGDYESAFEMLTKLVTEDWILQDAIVIDGEDRITIPVKAFDGQPIQVHIRALQDQWQLLLSDQPVLSGASTKQRLKSLYAQLDVYYDDMLNHLGKMISVLEIKKALLSKQSNESLRLRVTQQYESLLKSNRRMYKQTKASRQANKTRLLKLENDLLAD